MKHSLVQRSAIGELATLLVPVHDRHLVVPNVTVAEIIPWRDPEPMASEAPQWLLGMLDWRQLSVPLISFEAINQEPAAKAVTGRRIAILNDVIGAPDLPFFGVVTTGVPRLLRVLADEIGADPEATTGPAETARVLVAGERGSIPDIEHIEREIQQELARLERV